MKILSGGCLCGAIRYTVSVPITELRACHCRDADHAGGSPLFSRREVTPENGGLRIGTLDAEHAGGMKITGNIWTSSARAWAHIDPASQQFPRQPDAPTKR